MPLTGEERLFDAVSEATCRALREAEIALPADVLSAIRRAAGLETETVARNELANILENIALAKDRGLPLCQDTGMPTFIIHTPAGFHQLPLRKAILSAIAEATDESIGRWVLAAGVQPDGVLPELLFCENETNAPRLFGAPATTPYPKDGINDHVVSGAGTVNPDRTGTRCAFWYRLTVLPGQTAELRLRLRQARRTATGGNGTGKEKKAIARPARVLSAICAPS